MNFFNNLYHRANSIELLEIIKLDEERIKIIFKIDGTIKEVIVLPFSERQIASLDQVKKLIAEKEMVPALWQYKS